ncbi:putative septum site-determining protein MinC [Leptotrichia trevisanii]|uniref:two-partner secretion domain-containing protein n=1 Tax=Leptotrichia trevisanii TaxID=109328 RepID=UPI00118CA625|nr:hemagglutinin repeat-containing protein [Leptotrichia trevisanii]BBM58099.1 putative septum site-determining protein MinC [Leptotrichia trevisanii]
MRGKSKILRKLTAALLLNVFSFNILADGLQVDPNSRYNTSLDRAQNGVPVVNISTPNGRGVSINEFLEYNVGREGQVLNNADNIGRSHLAGIINANPNLGPNQAANLILLQVNGANRSQIEGYIEALSRQKVNVILSNENGIYLNGAGTINIKNFIPTTGRVKLKDGDVIGIDVEKGRVIIGAGGFDATNTDYVNVIAKAMELQGNLVGNRVDVTLGENTVDSNGTVASKNGINSVAIDASNLGSMYAGQIKIVSTDKGAGVSSNGLIYSRDTKLEITADGKINVAKIKGNGIEINGTEYTQSELASSDKGININASKIKLSGETQANGDINLNGNIENKSNIYTGGNLNTLDMINSGNINASGNITAKDFKNSLATVLSGGNFNVKNLDNSGNIQVSGITDINGKFDNTGALTSVKRISVLGNVASTGNILTNEDLTARNTVTSGTVAAKNLKVDNLTNDGKISANGNLLAKDIKNTGEILAVGKISGNSFVTSGKVQTNEALDINGFLDNSGTVGAAKDITVAGNVLNSGEILTNGNLTAKKVESTGDITVVGKISSNSLKLSGTLRTNEDLSIKGRFDNDGTVETSKNVAVSGDINNTGKILASGNLSGKNTVSSGVIASKNVVVDNLKNDGKITAGENIKAKKVTNTGDIAAAGTVSSDDMKTSGTVKANKTITVAGKLENDGTLETAEDVKVSGNIRNTGRIASNGDLTGKDTVTSGTISSKNVTAGNLQNDGKIIANGNINAKNIKNTKDMTAVGTVSADDLITSGNVRSNGKITVSGRLENSGAVETSKNISVAGNIKNDGKIAANDDLTGKNTENNGNIYVKNLEVNNLKNTGKVEGVNLKTDDIANGGDITAIGKVSSGNIDNSGKLLANDTINAKNIKNINKIAAGKGITGERIDNSGTFATNGDIKATSSLVNSGTVDGKGIDVAGAEFTNSGKINGENIKANVVNTRNDGFIYSGNDIDLTTNTLINTKEITAVNNINAANAAVTNNGKIASNNRVLLDNSAITNTGEILSGEIFMRNAQRFDNTGTIKGNNVELGINQDINLTGNLHGQQRLKISANNITNNGNTTGTGLIEINSNDFTNNRELASDTVVVNGRGEVVNNSMITGNNGKVSGKNITNNDLIAFENYLEMNAQGKVQNNKGKAIYGGQTLIVKANEIMNDEAEILGGNMDLNATKITNNVATIQSTGNITITSSDFQNIGRVSNLGNYEKYYETWDGTKISEGEIVSRWIDFDTDGETVSKNKHRRWSSFKRRFIDKLTGRQTTLTDKIPSFLLTLDTETLKREAKDFEKVETGSALHPEIPLKGKIKSNAVTEYGKILASGNITVNSGNFKNKDSIISGGGSVNINATNFENSVTLGNAVQLKNGKEKISYHYDKKKRGTRWKLHAKYERTLEDSGIGYESGQPSVIEGQQVIVNAPNIIQNPIEAGRGKEFNNGGAIGRTLLSSTSVGVNKGIGSANGQVQVSKNTLLSKVNNSFNGNSQINGSGNLNNPINNNFDRTVQIAGNNSGIKDIKNTGRISVNPILSSAMFTANMNPSSKYLMETRSKYINLGRYLGSDYFTSRVGYSEVWDRAKRLGDAYYEDQLITRALAEKLGTAFINGKSNEELIQAMMDNAATEGVRLGLTVGQELTQDQINNLKEDIVWYVTKNVNGVEVLAPQVYLSKNTRSIINDDTRNRVGGINGTYIETNNFVNNGTKYGNGGTTIVKANTVRNETTTNLLSEISGDRTFVSSVGNIENIGGLIGGRDLVSVVSQNGDVINRTTTREVGYNNGEFDRTRFTDVVSVAEISSKNGPTYIQGKNYTSTGAITAGNTVRIDASENVNINALKLTGEQKFGRNGDNYGSYGFVNHLQSAVNGTDGVMITSGKDTNISGSQVASLGNVNINAQNINITNVVNSESIESKRVNSGFISTETKTNSAYIESNQGSRIFGNNVVLDSKKDTNVIASDIMARKDESGNGGNILVTAGDNVNILSDTTSQSSSSTTSKTKSIGSLNVGSKVRTDGMAQVIQNSSRLSANGGNIVVKSGKDTLIGASELQSTESIGLVAGGNVVVTGLDEKYGESSSKSKGGMFRGGHLYKGNSESEKNQNITNKESVIRAGKDIVVKGENVGILGSDLDAGQDINVDAKNGIIVKSRNEVYSSENQKNETKVGFFAKGHNLSFEAGIEAKSKSDASATKQIRPDESTLVANGNINLKSGENIYFEGDAASGQDINLDSKNIFIADSEGRVEYMNESKETRVSFGVDMNFNNIPKTVESFKNYYKGLERLGHLEDLVTPIRKLAKGDDLLGAFHGREKAINGFNDLFAGPTEGSGKAGLYLKASMDRTSSSGNEGTIERTGLTAGNNINIRGTEKVGIRGTDIKSYNDINIQTKNLDIQASKSDITNQNKAYGISGEINALDPSLSVSGYYNSGKTEGYTYNNAKIDAANNLNIQIDNGTIRGANISANNLNVAVKNNLEVESLQDYEKMRQIGINASVGNVTGENKSYGGGVNYTGRDKNWVNEQTSLIGRNSVNVEVGNKLTIAGAKIANEENGIDKGNLIVKANEIEARDIVSKDNFLALDANANITRRDIYRQGRIAERYENDGGAGFAGSEVEKVSRATIGNGTIVTNQGTVGVNRDISKSDEKTRDVEVKRVRIDYNDERREWGEVNAIISENAGTIGKFTDKISFIPQFVAGKSNEETFREATFKTIRQVEDAIDFGMLNQELGLIPTSGQHGAVGEQLVKTFIKDKNPIYKLVARVDANGKIVTEYKLINRLGELTPDENGKVRVFANGMAEELERAGANAINQYITKEDYERLKNNPNETFEVGLVYNKTRGRIWDGIESGIGKMQNGSPNNFGLTTGVSRGMKDALSTYDPNVTYEVRGYSQGNINLEGALNDTINKGEKFAFIGNNRLELSHSGSPKADMVFVDLAKKTGAKEGSVVNIGSASNIKDMVTSEVAGPIKGIFSEMSPIRMTENFDKAVAEYKNNPPKDKTSKTPIVGEALQTYQEYALVGLPELYKIDKKGKTIQGDFNIDEVKKTVKTQGLKGFEGLENVKSMQDLYYNYPKMYKAFNKYVSEHHRLYFNKDVGIAVDIMKQEEIKIESLKNHKEKDSKENYENALREQKRLIDQRKKNVKDMLMNVPRVNPDYGKDMDKDLFNARDNALTEQLNKDFPRNNPYKNINPDEGLNMPKPEINREKSQNINEQLKKLRERVGN